MSSKKIIRGTNKNMDLNFSAKSYFFVVIQTSLKELHDVHNYRGLYFPLKFDEKRDSDGITGKFAVETSAMAW